MYFSSSKMGFYSVAIHGRSMPDDVVEISDQEHQAILVGVSEGKRLVADSRGRPVLSDPLPPTRKQIEAARLRLYADPLAGSDRYFAEAQRESLLGNTEAADAAKSLGMGRFAEIQAEYPWPTE